MSAASEASRGFVSELIRKVFAAGCFSILLFRSHLLLGAAVVPPLVVNVELAVPRVGKALHVGMGGEEAPLLAAVALDPVLILRRRTS